MLRTESVDELALFIESRFNRVEYTDKGSKDIVAIMHSGIHKEGERIPFFATNEKTAIEMASKEFDIYRKDHPGDTLVWRIKPEVRSFTAYEPCGESGEEYKFHLFERDCPVVIHSDMFHDWNFYACRMRLAIRP